MRALILAPFSDDGIAALRKFARVVHEDWRLTGKMWDPRELGGRLDAESFDAVIVEHDFLFDETFEAAPSLKLAGICRAAVNQIDVEAASARGVAVINTPGRNANAVAELALALMFALARRVTEADSYVREGRWQSPADPYKSLRGSELSGKTVGIVGFGATGRRVAAICIAIGMQVLVHDPLVNPSAIRDAGADPRDLGELLSSADFVSLHAPPQPDGKPIIDAADLATMRASAFLVNTAAAELVNTDALAHALRSGRLAGAGYDVYETAPVEPTHPLLRIDRVILTPHIGGATDETIARHSRSIVEDLRRFSRGERPLNLVNQEAWEHRRAAR